MISLVEAICDDFPEVQMDQPTEPTRIVCTGRPIALKRCLTNLIDNAVKYGKRARVTVAEREGAVEVAIADEGEGIPAAEIESVFQPFERRERSRNRETGGIGLGLALARAIVRDAGGDVTLANRPEGGLAATIVLPRAA